MKLSLGLLMLLGAASVARAGEALPPVADVIAHARAVMDKKPDGVVCKVVVDTQLLDRSGKPEHNEHREAKAVLHGNDQDLESQSVVRDGQPLSADTIAEEQDKIKKQKAEKKKKPTKGADGFDVSPSPLEAANAPNESFELVRKETLWGRPAYVVKVRAQKASPQQSNGTLWIDAERFIELKGELSPSAMPPHADWIRVQEQFAPGPAGVAVPTYLHIEGAGHMLFLHKQFRTTLRWSDCR